MRTFILFWLVFIGLLSLVVSFGAVSMFLLLGVHIETFFYFVYGLVFICGIVCLQTARTLKHLGDN
jgi:hypothetical protein